MTATRREALNAFFISVQARALRQTEMATGRRDEALDLLQDAMIRLAQHYADCEADWPKLFQRILQNAIRDWYRKQKVRSILRWFGSHEEIEAEIALQTEENHAGSDSPEAKLLGKQTLKKIEGALQQLPARQREAFLLRAWWGYDTEETAFAMQCSSGSVKTHYSRALAAMKPLLEDLNCHDTEQ